jgi:hypothetical protein
MKIGKRKLKCPQCKIIFNKRGQNNKFCSNKCRDRFNYVKINGKAEKKECPVCKKRFQQVFRGHIYCTSRCTGKANYLKREFNIKIDDVFDIYKKQKGKCGICESKMDGIFNTNLDHNHATGKIRGLLCGNCNFLLGHAKDDIGILRKAIIYLNRYEKCELASAS